NLASRPLIIGDRIYYASRGGLGSLDRQTGAPEWRTPLPHTASRMQIARLGEDRLALVGTAYRYESFGIEGVAPPWVALVDRKSGRLLAHRTVPELDLILDCRAGAGGSVLLLGSRQVLRLDPALTR